MDGRPTVYISILNWNDKDIARELLESLYSNTKYDNFEVGVVDNGSSDGSVEMIQSEFLSVILIKIQRIFDFQKGIIRFSSLL